MPTDTQALGLESTAATDNFQSNYSSTNAADRAAFKPSKEIPGARAVWVSDARQTKRILDKADNTLKVGEKLALQYESPLKHKKLMLIVAAVGGAIFFVLFIMLANESFKALSYKQHLNTGFVALEQGDYNLADVEFTLALKANPSNSDVYYYRGLAEAGRGSIGNAAADYDKALELNNRNSKVFLAQALLAIRTHKFEDAVNGATKAMEMQAFDADAYRIRTSAYNHLGRFDEAIVDSTRYLNAHKTQDIHRADALAKRAFAYDQKKSYGSALIDYTDALSCDPENPALHAARAIVYMQLRQWQNSLNDCEFAMNHRKNDAVLYKVAGICKSHLDRGHDSLKDLDMLVALHENVDTHRLRLDERFSERDYLGTLQDGDYVLGAEPDDKVTHHKYQKAKIALQSKAKRTSVVADEVHYLPLPKANDLNQPVEKLIQNGYKLVLSGDNEPAVEYLLAAIKKAPNSASARRYLAWAYSQSGMHADAASQFRALAALDSLTLADKLKYGHALFACEQKSAAIGIYTSVLASLPNNDEARTSLIKALMDTGSLDEAVRLAQQGKDSTPTTGRYDKLLRQAIGAKQSKANRALAM
jgi:tetratricopeptide (TPR) repeat protein